VPSPDLTKWRGAGSVSKVHFAPDLQAKSSWVSETGRAPDKLLEDAMAGYVPELIETCEMLDSRYDDLKSGRVKPIPGDEVAARLGEKSVARRSQAGS
jgi:hypothetical protein